MNSFICSLLVLARLFFIHHSPVQKAGDLKVEITGLRSSGGFVLLSLFNQEDGFPSDANKAYRKDKKSITGNKVSFEYKNLPAGTYAIALLHDENGNLKMDTKFLGLPKEGYGFSRDPKLRFGPPAFKNASFEHTSDQTIAVSMKY